MRTYFLENLWMSGLAAGTHATIESEDLQGLQEHARAWVEEDLDHHVSGIYRSPPGTPGRTPLLSYCGEKGEVVEKAYGGE